MIEYIYSSNNSGGSWWLSEDDWQKLEDAGWTVFWGGRKQESEEPKYSTLEAVKTSKNGLWLGAVAKEAHKHFNSHEEAVAEFEQITGEDYNDEGCECCGNPHFIY